VSLGKYALIVTVLLVGSLALAWPLLRGLEPGARRAAALGGALAAANSVAAYWTALWAVGRSNVAFMRAVLGGMGARMAVLLGAVVAAILWLELPRVPLALALVGYFIVFLVLELSVLHRSHSARTEAR
jgi:hypothetical protein